VSERGWQRKFDDPMPLPSGREVAFRDAADYSYAVCSRRNQERHSYCLQVAAKQTNAGNEKAAGIFALRPPGLRLIGLINVDPPAPVLRRLGRLSTDVESEMLFQRRNTMSIAKLKHDSE
jgi:hypothetical protein